MRIIHSILSLFIVFAASAQHVVTTAGQSANVEGLLLEWTLGETVVHTIAAQGIHLTQGFHQPGVLVTFVHYPAQNNFRVQVYPNPASTLIKLNVETEAYFEIFYRISDISGRQIMQQRIYSAIEEIDVSGLRAGIYFMQVFTDETMGSRLFTSIKIIKL